MGYLEWSFQSSSKIKLRAQNLVSTYIYIYIYIYIIKKHTHTKSWLHTSWNFNFGWNSPKQSGMTQNFIWGVTSLFWFAYRNGIFLPFGLKWNEIKDIAKIRTKYNKSIIMLRHQTKIIIIIEQIWIFKLTSHQEHVNLT